jgi:hypothetical protein
MKKSRRNISYDVKNVILRAIGLSKDMHSDIFCSLLSVPAYSIPDRLFQWNEMPPMSRRDLRFVIDKLN